MVVLRINVLIIRVSAVKVLSLNCYFSTLCRLLGVCLLLLLISACSTTPEPKPEAPKVQRQPLVDYALSLQGVPYRWGKASPTEGFDCSGFVQYVYRQHGIHIPRTVQEMAIGLPEVPKNELIPGDLLLFNTKGRKASHVGLFVCDDKFVHAPSQRAGKVMVSSLNNSYWRRRLIGVRRPQHTPR